ncbi:MAG: hypothetical protein H6Q64_1999, partial [Firmicutes bacterium]|nr:hypothetical protein [Bacillota bacterium]
LQDMNEAPQIIIDDKEIEGAQEKSGFWIKVTQKAN